MAQLQQRYPLSPPDMLDIAMQHRQAATILLQRESHLPDEAFAVLAPVGTLLYSAIELSLKAFVLQDYPKLRPQKGLFPLIEQLGWLVLSVEEQKHIRCLQQQQAFRKGQEYHLWDNTQQCMAFLCTIMEVHDAILEQSPLELQADYLA